MRSKADIRFETAWSRVNPIVASSGLRATGCAVSVKSKKSTSRHRDSGMNRSRSKRSEEHTSELQSQSNLVCRLLLEKKNNDQPALVLAHGGADSHLRWWQLVPQLSQHFS